MGRGSVPRQVQVLAATAFGLVAAFVGFLAWGGSQRGDIVIVSDPSLVRVVVEVRGEVARPGVYELDGDGRVGELVELAGGLTPRADVRALNLARRLRDEEVVVVPAVGVATPVATPVVGTDVPTAATGLVNINTASTAELEALPGIGEVLAGRIVAYREANGPFGRVEDLGRVEGVSDATVEELRDLVTVGP